MKKISLIALVLFCGAAIALTGCGKKAILYTANAKTYAESYQQVTKGMSAAQKEKFDNALNTYREQNYKRYMSMCGNNVAAAKQTALLELDEMTADQIIAKANEKK